MLEEDWGAVLMTAAYSTRRPGRPHAAVGLGARPLSHEFEQVGPRGRGGAHGRALGLGTPAPGVDSVLGPERPQPRTAPTGRDVESFCRLYGRPTFCGD